MPKQARSFVGFDRHLRADAIAIRARAHGLHPQHVVLISIVVAQQPCRAIVGRNHQIQIAVVVEISVGRAAAHDRPLQRGTEFRGHFFKLVLAQIAEKMRRLRILHVGLHHADVVGNVAVDGENIQQAIEIIVKEESAEGERAYRYPG